MLSVGVYDNNYDITCPCIACKLSRSLLRAMTKNGVHTQIYIQIEDERANELIIDSFVSVSSVLRSTDKSNNILQASPAPSWTSIMFSHALAMLGSTGTDRYGRNDAIHFS